MNKLFFVILIFSLCSCYSTNCITIGHSGEEDSSIYPIAISNKRMSQEKLINLFTDIDRDKMAVLYKLKVDHSTAIGNHAYKKLEREIQLFNHFEEEPDIRYGTLKISIWHNGILVFQSYVYSKYSVEFLKSICPLFSNHPVKEQQIRNMISRLDISDSRKPASIYNLK